MYVRNIQHKIWHNRIATHRFLYQIGILDSPNCIYCNEEENITQTFNYCPYIKRFWREVETFAKYLEYGFTHLEGIEK